MLDRLRNRPDSEHEQAIVRVVLLLGVLGYFIAAQGLDGPQVGAILLYQVFSLAMVGWIIIAPAANPLRRVVAMLADFGAMSLLMFLAGETAAPLYPLFLWVALGNGFRYGVQYLLGSMVVGTASFAVVVATSEPWRNHLGLSLGLLAGLVVVPAYAATLIRKLTEAKAQAEAASRAKSRFLAIISHELRTPLNAVIGMADLLDHTKLDSKQREMSHTIRLSGQALLTLIDSVLDFSRIEAGKTVVTVSSVDLQRSLADLMAVLAPQAESKGLRIGVTLAADMPPWVKVDWPHMRQILTNLIANAIKFTEAGEVRVEVCRIAGPEGDRLGIDVVDTGIGIAPEKIEHIFESFAQADDHVNRRYGGTGLGLTISRQLAELLGGSLHVDSVLGEGSRFRLEVPLQVIDVADPAMPAVEAIMLARDEAVVQQFADIGIACRRAADGAELAQLMKAAAGKVAVFVDGSHLRNASAIADQGIPVVAIGAADCAEPIPLVQLPVRPDLCELRWAVRACAVFTGAPEPQMPLEMPRVRSLRVLLAEDNAINRRVMGLILERGGHRFEMVGTGDELLDEIESRSYDIVITDVNMPGTSVIEVVKLHRMAHLGDNEYLPIIACSADATPETRRVCEEAGFDAFLTKPVVAATLLGTVADLVRPTQSIGDLADGKIADLTAHPNFSGPSASPVDWHAIDGLLELGDKVLVAELVAEFLHDASGLLEAMADAGARGETSRFRAECHALRSCASNMGARSVARACQAAGNIDPGALTSQYRDLCQRARGELKAYSDEMRRLLSDRQSSTSS